MHHELFNAWRESRAEAGLNQDFRSFVHAPRHGVVSEVVSHRWYGSSGLYMAQVAFDALGATEAVLCGVPMLSEAGHIAKPGPWTDVERYRGGFLEAKADGANIHSMSGWTAELFGLPKGARS